MKLYRNDRSKSSWTVFVLAVLPVTVSVAAVCIDYIVSVERVESNCTGSPCVYYLYIPAKGTCAKSIYSTGSACWNGEELEYNKYGMGNGTCMESWCFDAVQIGGPVIEYAPEVLLAPCSG